MTPTFTLRRWALRREAPPRLAVVSEFKLNPEVFAAKQRDGFLQIVARGRSDSHLLALNRGLNLFEFRFLDRRGDLLRGLAVEGHLQPNVTANSVAARLLDLARIEVLHRDAALNELRLKHVPERLHLVVVLSGESDFAFGAIQLDGGRRSLEVVALGDLLLRLIDGVVDLLEVDARRDVER